MGRRVSVPLLPLWEETGMIDRLILKNFQRHEELRLSLDRVTTFTGPSDSGKTAILRALRWLAENKPTGDGFIRDGAKSCSVAARVDGKWVVRARDHKENVYEFNGECYQSLKATSVPTPIADLLNMGEVNYQSQLAAPYWLSDTGGEVAKNLNAVINLGEIDAVLARAVAAVRDLRAREKLIAERLAAAETAAAEREWTVAAMEEWAAVEAIEQEWNGVVAKRGELTEAMDEWDALDARLAAKTAEADAGDVVVAVGKEWQTVTYERQILTALLDEHDRYERILADDPGPAWDELAAVRAAGDAAAEAARTLRVLLEDYDAAETGVVKWESDVMKLEAELAAGTEGLCPLCGQPAAPDSLRSSHQIGTCPPESPARAARQPVRSGGKRRDAI